MKQTTGKIYICDYCGRKITNPGACGVHEKHCRKNPRNIHLCMGCEHLEVSTKTYMVPASEYPWVVGAQSCKAFYCKAYDQYMYTYKKRDLGKRKGIKVYDDKRRETFQCEEMPTETAGGCERYKSYVLAQTENNRIKP